MIPEVVLLMKPEPEVMKLISVKDGITFQKA